MDFKQLRALIAVAETGSVTRASELLHIVQPAVSRQLRLLEEDLGVPLFQRERYGMTPTEAGAVLVERAQRALRELDQARDEIYAEFGTLSGVVSVGLLPSTAELLAGPLVSSLKARHPQLQVSVTVAYAGHLEQWLESGDIDIALLYGVRTTSTRQVRALLEERLCLVGPCDADLRMDQPIKLCEAAALPLVLPTPPHGLRVLFEHACAVAGLPFSITALTNSMAVQKSLVMHGQGYTILPSVSVHDDVAGGRLSAAPITEPDLCRTVVLARPASRRTSARMLVLLDALFELIREQVQQGRWPGAAWRAD